MDELVIYSTLTCGMCFAVKGWLRAWGVHFREVDIAEDAEARRYVQRVARGYLSVPTLRLPDGTVLVEPTRSALAAALGLAAQG